MPRHASNSRTAVLTSPSINLLPASLIQFHSEGSSSSSNSNSRAALSRRRQILKHIPQVETATPPQAETSVRPARAPGAIPTTSIASNLGEFSAKVGSSLPVVRAGATFLSTLHTSVALSASLHPPSNPASAPPSPCLFPQFSPLVPTSTTVRRRLSASMASEASDPVPAGPAPLPPLDFVAASTETERVDGLKLVADSIAQRRQLASFALMTHPYFLGLMGLVFAGVYKYLYKGPGDWALIMTTSTGFLMAGFIAIRTAVQDYIELAESINLTWLDDDEIVVARWGEGEDRKIIGSVVWKFEKASGSGHGRHGKKIATIRAWTTRDKQRGIGVGKGLIEETIKQAKARGAEEMRWEDENIYEKRILPKWANGGFEDGLKAARTKLEGYIKEYWVKK